ncbi:GDSL-type esterase/lipase family protein [Synechococcus sp. UW140]|uniref:GDSL-type esterase/lipase family protein n=1 Tax=Synechococcus sp. UW140 TaxID=368503 RepID=UPI003137ACD3
METAAKFIAFGDSGVFGWGDSEGGGWVERLRRHWMPRLQAPVLYNLGVRGDGLERLSNRLNNEFMVRGELRRQKPQGMLIAVGINDAARIGRCDGRQQLDPPAFLFGFEQLLINAKCLAPVFVVGLTPVNEAVMPFANCLWYLNRDLDLYNRLIEEACLGANVPFLRLWDGEISATENVPLEWSKRLCSDGIHCNSAGHEWIFEQVSCWPELLLWAGLPPEGFCRLN